MKKTLPKIFKEIAEQYPNIDVQYSRTKNGNFSSITYSEMYKNILSFAGGLLSLGEQRGNRIGLISDNRAEWQQADFAIMAIGAVDTPRGCDATEKDLSYILSFSECSTVIAENTFQVRKILSIHNETPLIKKIISFDSIEESEKISAAACDVELYEFNNIIERGNEYNKLNPFLVEKEIECGDEDDLASIIFTSGTTGTPKGVMLSHKNFITQLDELKERIFVNPGEKCLCILPIWHVFQRACEYVVICQAGALCYSRPIGSVMLADIQKLNPQIIPGVPRVFSGVYDGIWKKMRKAGGITFLMFKFAVSFAQLYCSIDRSMFRKQARFANDFIVFKWIGLILPWLVIKPLYFLCDVFVLKKIRALFGKKLRACIVGGGSYPTYIDKFFWAVGVNIVEGYGLTETAPVVCVRPIVCPVLGTIGSALRGIQIRVVDDEGKILGKCKKGNVQIKGDNVMRGYYKRPELTAKVMTNDGWFDTGDIGILTLDGELQLRGRKKDTIVLQGGENVEPIPIEQTINTSKFVAASVVLGQDQRYLGVLVLPNEEVLKKYAEANGIIYSTYKELTELEDIKKLFESEISSLVNTKNGFKSFEHVNKVCIITKPFEVGVELSAKQEVMRYRINELYKPVVDEMFRV